ncbi:MAG: ABC transporter ATP-binding protein [Anaerolineales bacterium]|nr:ABC transporter ATP-binding protein [Anaerolineales bacterium]
MSIDLKSVNENEYSNNASEPILSLKNLSKHFGGLKAVNDVTMDVKRDTLHSIIGPNGAGKTTLFNLISGRLPATSGQIFFEGNDITRLPQYRIAHLGIGRSYQITTVFQQLTVEENIRVSVQALTSQYNFWRNAKSFREVNERTDEILETIGLIDKRALLAAQLGHAEQRQLDVGIALAANPKLLLLDEPTAGMSPVETDQIMHFVRELAESVTIILVEHKIKVVMSISDRVTVLNFGSVLAEGTPTEVQNDPRVKAAYLEGSV